jgi:hypothetical protein
MTTKPKTRKAPATKVRSHRALAAKVRPRKAVVLVAPKPRIANAVAAEPDDPIFELIKFANAARDIFLLYDISKPENTPVAMKLGEAMHRANESLYVATPQTRAGTLAYAAWCLRYHGCRESLLAALKREFAA